MALGSQAIDQNIQHTVDHWLWIGRMGAIKPHRKPLNNRKNRRANNGWILLFNQPLRHALLDHITALAKDLRPASINIVGMHFVEGRDLCEHRKMGGFAVKCVDILIKVRANHLNNFFDAIGTAAISVTSLLQPHITARDIALIDQIFFGFDIVINTGFGQIHAAGDIRQGRRPRTLPIK